MKNVTPPSPTHQNKAYIVGLSKFAKVIYDLYAKSTSADKTKQHLFTEDRAQIFQNSKLAQDFYPSYLLTEPGGTRALLNYDSKLDGAALGLSEKGEIYNQYAQKSPVLTFIDPGVVFPNMGV